MPNDINATSATATPPSFSLGIAPNYLGVVSLVNSTGEVVRRWRLQHTKCTIGSDRQATIWIDDNKIASFHALLVFGSTNAIIKSFGPGLRLNGQSVQESAIRVGDRLELLGYQFLIESLSTSPLNSHNNAKVPDASSALDSAQLSRPQPAISTETVHLSKLEGRVDQLLQRLGDIDDKITRTSSEQKDDFSRQCDSLRNETEHLRRIITQDFSTQLRALTDDLERQSKSRETRFDAKFQTLSDEFKNLCSDVENSFESLQQQTDQRWTNVEQNQQKVDSRISQLESVQQQSNQRFAQLESLSQKTNDRFEQLQQQNEQLASNISNVSPAVGVTPEDFNNFQDRVVDLVQTIQGDLQNVREGLDAKLEQVTQDSNDRLTQIEMATAALNSRVNQAAAPSENGQPEIEALQARLAQLESVLADLAATVHDRSVAPAAAAPYFGSSASANASNYFASSPTPTYAPENEDVPRHDNYNDFSGASANVRSENLRPGQGAITERFNSDTTSPYRGSNNSNAGYPEEEAHNSAESVYQRYVESLDPNGPEDIQPPAAASALPAWFTQGQQPTADDNASHHSEQHTEENTEEYVDNSYSPLLRSSDDEEQAVQPIAQWSTGSASSIIDNSHAEAYEDRIHEEQVEEAFNEDVSHSPLLRSLLREESPEPTAEESAESPMFNQKDWDESDSYLQTERQTSVSALDILRASYGESGKDQFDDEQEEKWANKLQQFSEAIHEEPEQTLSAVGRVLTEEQAQAYAEEEVVEEEAPPPPPAPTPSRLGASSARGRSAAATAPASEAAAPADDDSVEAYMQRLLARMRGDEVEEVKPTATSSAPAAKASPAKSAGASKVVRNTYSPIRKTRQDPAAALIASRPKVDEEGGEAVESTDDDKPELTPEVTVSRSAPEKASDMAALRELANDSARAAVKTSDKKVKPVSNTIKLTIAGLAAAFGVVLLVSNGLRVNLTLVAAATSFMLSAIWIMDVVQAMATSKKRDQNNNGANAFQMKISGKK
jgi:hypothetical protein